FARSFGKSRYARPVGQKELFTSLYARGTFYSMQEQEPQTQVCAYEAETLSYISGETASEDLEPIEAHITRSDRSFNLMHSFARLVINEDASSAVPESIYDETEASALALIKEQLSRQASEARPSTKAGHAGEKGLLHTLFDWLKSAKIIFIGVAVVFL